MTKRSLTVRQRHPATLWIKGNFVTDGSEGADLFFDKIILERGAELIIRHKPNYFEGDQSYHRMPKWCLFVAEVFSIGVNSKITVELDPAHDGKDGGPQQPGGPGEDGLDCPKLIIVARHLHLNPAIISLKGGKGGNGGRGGQGKRGRNGGSSTWSGDCSDGKKGKRGGPAGRGGSGGSVRFITGSDPLGTKDGITLITVGGQPGAPGVGGPGGEPGRKRPGRSECNKGKQGDEGDKNGIGLAGPSDIVIDRSSVNFENDPDLAEVSQLFKRWANEAEG